MLGKWLSPAELPETRGRKVSALDQETLALTAGPLYDRRTAALRERVSQFYRR